MLLCLFSKLIEQAENIFEKTLELLLISYYCAIWSLQLVRLEDRKLLVRMIVIIVS
jgi:hypothetical protein